MTVIGVTGHRVLSEPETIRAAVDVALRRIEECFSTDALSVVSALAEGADRIVAEKVLAHPDARLVAVLPLPRLDYLRDFKSDESKAEFSGMVERASEVIELPALTPRELAYEAAGDYVLDHCDVLITIWDGKKAQGRGGTGAVVERARKRGLPIAWIRAANRKAGSTEPDSRTESPDSVVFENF